MAKVENQQRVSILSNLTTRRGRYIDIHVPNFKHQTSAQLGCLFHPPRPKEDDAALLQCFGVARLRVFYYKARHML